MGTPLRGGGAQQAVHSSNEVEIVCSRTSTGREAASQARGSTRWHAAAAAAPPPAPRRALTKLPWASTTTTASCFWPRMISNALSPGVPSGTTVTSLGRGAGGRGRGRTRMGDEGAARRRQHSERAAVRTAPGCPLAGNESARVAPARVCTHLVITSFRGLLWSFTKSTSRGVTTPRNLPYILPVSVTTTHEKVLASCARSRWRGAAVVELQPRAHLRPRSAARAGALEPRALTCEYWLTPCCRYAYC